jgi:FAD/FMN-containing dehydrogenase
MTDWQVINKSGDTVDEAAVLDFRASLSGEVIRPGDTVYDAARKVWNGMIDKYPSLIVYCVEEDDIVKSVNFARDNNILTSVRSGGHNVAGNAVCDNGIVIDLSRMKRTDVNENMRTAVAQGGLTLGDLDRATQERGLAVPVGIVSKTGMAGLTLGGGIGWLMRKYGLTCDNLLSAKIVTADGNTVTADPDENPDLFWGIRGAGGNFGIVTGFTFRLHPVRQVIGGIILYPASSAKDVFRFYRDYITGIPDELTTMLAFLPAPPPFLPGPDHKTPLMAVHVCYTGEIKEGKRVLEPLRLFGMPLHDTVRAMPYIELQGMLDSGAPFGLLNYWKSSYLQSLDDTVMDLIVEYFHRTPSPLTQIHIQHLQGAVSRVGEDETAFSHRDALCVINLVSKWTDAADSETNIQWTRDFANQLEPHSVGAYVNFMGAEGHDRVRAAYSPATYTRLVELKNKFDPMNFFCLNQNIRPTV